MRKTKCIVLMACLLWMPATYGAGADLIQPTRTLKDENVNPGKLFVFSEPPGLVVTLDGKALGKAPVYLDSVTEGPHKVQVAGKDTTIVIAPGEVRRLSFFKGKIIHLTSEETGTSEKPQAAEQKPAQKPESEQKAQKSEQLEPGYFPLNPRGPIY